MAFLNNLLEFRSDAFKMTVHYRRPIPTRTDTIGPWMDALVFLTWFAALMNAALVYLFSPQLTPTTWSAIAEAAVSAVTNETEPTLTTHLASASGGVALKGASPTSFSATKDLLLKTALVALLASHGFILLRLVVRHIVERTFWFGSKELGERDREIKEAREEELKGMAGGAAVIGVEKVIIEREVIPVGGTEKEESGNEERENDEMMFWEKDEGIEEIQRILKEA
jgi:anoctamin-10